MNRPPRPRGFAENRRYGEDRRQKPTSPFSLASLFGRRKEIRRAQDRSTHRYVDRYPRSYGVCLMAVLLLSLIDGFLTMVLAGRGVEKVNPLLGCLLHFGPIPFLLGKYLLAVVGATWLLIHKNFVLFGGRLKVENLLFILPVLYGLVVLYEISLWQH